MNETIQKMLGRRSVRKYRKDPVPADLLETVIEAGLYAASGRNIQAPIIVAVTNSDEVAALSKANADVMGSSGDPFYGAPAVLIVLSENGDVTAIASQPVLDTLLETGLSEEEINQAGLVSEIISILSKVE